MKGGEAVVLFLGMHLVVSLDGFEKKGKKKREKKKEYIHNLSLVLGEYLAIKTCCSINYLNLTLTTSASPLEGYK